MDEGDANKREVYILGAGSSASYGFPTGKEMREIILNGGYNDEIKDKAKKLEMTVSEFIDRDKMTDDEYAFYIYYNKMIKEIILHFLTNNEVFLEQYRAFKNSFERSGSTSIDSFLEKKKGSIEEDIGKYLISIIIGYYQRQERLVYDSDDDWISYFFQRKISYDLGNFLKNPPMFITFNYDTYFENKLAIHLHEVYDFEKSYNMVKALDFHHVYGKLRGEYPIGERTFEEIVKESENIEIVDNVRGQRIEFFNEIRRQINNAPRIIILGYGFDRINNEILFTRREVMKSYGSNKIYATGFGIPESFLRLLRGDFFVKIDAKEKCLDLLENSALIPALFPGD